VDEWLLGLTGLDLGLVRLHVNVAFDGLPHQSLQRRRRQCVQLYGQGSESPDVLPRARVSDFQCVRLVRQLVLPNLSQRQRAPLDVHLAGQVHPVNQTPLDVQRHLPSARVQVAEVEDAGRPAELRARLNPASDCIHERCGNESTRDHHEYPERRRGALDDAAQCILFQPHLKHTILTLQWIAVVLAQKLIH